MDVQPMTPTWRTWLIDRPATIVDWAWRIYWTIVAALTILCYINVLLWLLAYLLGLRLPGPRP
jgi:hypothetical protein